MSDQVMPVSGRELFLDATVGDVMRIAFGHLMVAIPNDTKIELLKAISGNLARYGASFPGDAQPTVPPLDAPPSPSS